MLISLCMRTQYADVVVISYYYYCYYYYAF